MNDVLAAFANPTAFHWPGYFWVLNDRLSEAKLLAQLRDMNSMGARSVCLLTEPPEFRPDTLGTEVDLPYLSEEYFVLIRKIVAESARLNLGEVKYACQVTLNGDAVSCRIWKPFIFDVSGRLRPGRNELRVIVTNTLANALLEPAVIARWDAMPRPGWPSSGNVYDTMARQFEKDSLPSGLYGPVGIEFGRS